MRAIHDAAEVGGQFGVGQLQPGVEAGGVHVAPVTGTGDARNAGLRWQRLRQRLQTALRSSCPSETIARCARWPRPRHALTSPSAIGRYREAAASGRVGASRRCGSMFMGSCGSRSAAVAVHAVVEGAAAGVVPVGRVAGPRGDRALRTACNEPAARASTADDGTEDRLAHRPAESSHLSSKLTRWPLASTSPAGCGAWAGRDSERACARWIGGFDCPKYADMLVERAIERGTTRSGQ